MNLRKWKRDKQGKGNTMKKMSTMQLSTIYTQQKQTRLLGSSSIVIQSFTPSFLRLYIYFMLFSPFLLRYPITFLPSIIVDYTFLKVVGFPCNDPLLFIDYVYLHFLNFLVTT